MKKSWFSDIEWSGFSIASTKMLGRINKTTEYFSNTLLPLYVKTVNLYVCIHFGLCYAEKIYYTYRILC